MFELNCEYCEGAKPLVSEDGADGLTFALCAGKN